jgi:hypothetical protein
VYRHWGSVHAVRPIEEVEVQFYSFMTKGTTRRWGVSVTPRPLFTPGKDPVPIVQEAGWAPRPVWTGAKNLAPTGIRSPDRPARNQSLYRLRYPAHNILTTSQLNPRYYVPCNTQRKVQTCEQPVYVYYLPTSDDSNQAQQVKHCILLIDKSRVVPSLHKNYQLAPWKQFLIPVWEILFCALIWMHKQEWKKIACTARFLKAK